MILIWRDQTLPRALTWAVGFATVFLFALPAPHTIALWQTSFSIAAFIVFFSVGPHDLKKLLAAMPLKAVFVAWALLALLSLAWAVMPSYSLREIKNEIAYPFMAYFLFFVLARGGLQLRIFYGAAVAMLIAAAMSSAWSRITGGEVSAPAYAFNGIGSYSTFLVAALPFAVLLWVRTTFVVRIGMLVALPVVLAPLWYATTRAAWVAIALALGTLLALVATKAPTLHFRRRAAIALLVVVVVTPLLFVEILAKRQGMEGSELPAIAETIANVDQRPALWRFVADKIGERPWTGYGFGVRSFAYAFPEMAKANLMLWHTHNLVLDYAFQLGVLGVVLLLAIFGSITREFWRIHRYSEDTGLIWLGAAGIALVVGVFTKSMTDIFFYRENAVLFWSLVGTVLGYTHHSRHSRPATQADS